MCLIRLKFKTYILHDYEIVNWWSGSREIYIFSICSIQYGCQSMWPINYSWTPGYPQTKCGWSVPSICQAALEKRIFKGLSSKVIAAKPCDLWRNRWRTFCSSGTGDHTCKVSPRSVQLFRRRRFVKVFMLKKIIIIIRYGYRTTLPKTSLIFFSPLIQFSPRWQSKIFILIG